MVDGLTCGDGVGLRIRPLLLEPFMWAYVARSLRRKRRTRVGLLLGHSGQKSPRRVGLRTEPLTELAGGLTCPTERLYSRSVCCQNSLHSLAVTSDHGSSLENKRWRY